MGLKREHRESLAYTVQDHEEDLFKMRGEQAARLCDQGNKLLDMERQIKDLQKKLTEVSVRKTGFGTRALRIFGVGAPPSDLPGVQWTTVRPDGAKWRDPQQSHGVNNNDMKVGIFR